ncbi:hypothetical protein FRC19_000939 [Serendipita sp. 401]|nr:hypothetical protein FRC19_000939 [Serendipita sp. 401]KAG9028865.1 hypothetical protein FS842_004688 [Serendipita sp. 407]
MISTADPTNDSLFPYHASTPATLIFAVAFALTLAVHIFQAAKARALFMLVLIIATALQVVGYALRKVAIDHDPQMWSYVTSQVCIVVSPAFVAAQCYMIVGRMMSYVGPESTFISHTVITKLFVILDIVCVLTQSVGVTVLSGSDNPTKSQVTTGRAILIGGLLVQVASFGVFVIVAILFDLKSRKLWGATHSALVRLRPLFLVFYISSILIIGRSIFRTVEFATIDFDKEAQGYLFNNEWPFYVLDSIPVLIATVVFNIVNPSAYLPRKKGLRMDGSHELPRKHWWSREIKTARSEEQMLGERA